MNKNNQINNFSFKKTLIILGLIISIFAFFFIVLGFISKSEKLKENLIAKNIIEFTIQNIEKKANVSIVYDNIKCNKTSQKSKDGVVCYINNVKIEKNKRKDKEVVFLAKNIKITNVIKLAKILNKYRKKQDISKEINNFQIEIGVSNPKAPIKNLSAKNIKYIRDIFDNSNKKYIDLSDYLMDSILASLYSEIKDKKAKEWLDNDLKDILDQKKPTYLGFKIKTKLLNKKDLFLENFLIIEDNKSILNIGFKYILKNWKNIILNKKNQLSFKDILNKIILKDILIEYSNKDKEHLKNVIKYGLSYALKVKNNFQGKINDQNMEKYFNGILQSMGVQDSNKIKVYNSINYVNGISHVKVDFEFNESLYKLLNNIYPLYYNYLNKFRDNDTALGFTITAALFILSKNINISF